MSSDEQFVKAESSLSIIEGENDTCSNNGLLATELLFHSFI